jgi:P4 family phage/plasmid primase-like protien
MVLNEVETSKAELFIENVLLHYFSIPVTSRVASIIRKRYKEKSKEAKENKKHVARMRKGIKDLDIAEEFEGLYIIEEDEKTHRIAVRPRFDQIAYTTIERLNVMIYKDNIYHYQDGYYQNNPKVVKAEATRILNGICKGIYSDGIKRHLADVMTVIEHVNPLTEYPFKGVKNAINVSNGVIIFDEKNGERRREDPDPIKYKFNYILPVEYNEDAVSDFIVGELDKYTDKPKTVIQLIAQILLQSMGYDPFKLAYLLYGPSNYGKSTLLQIIKKLIGTKLISGVGLNRMSNDGNDRFALAPLEGKLLNLKEEMPKFRMNDSNQFKEVLGSYDIAVEPKHIDQYMAITTAVHAFATNSTPDFDSSVRDDDAFWKKWILIPFTKTCFPMNETYAKNTLLTDENMSALLNEALAMIRNYIQTGELPYRSHKGDEWKKVREEWLQAGNPLYKFIIENFVKGGETSLIKDELLTVLNEWCDEGNVLDPNAKPTTLNDLIEVIRLCDGKIDARRDFEYYNPNKPEIKKDKYGKIMIGFQRHCYILPWQWKKDGYGKESKWKAKFHNAVMAND